MDTHSRTRALGKRIRARRRDLSLTQDDLADVAHVSQGAISRIERGKAMPNLPTLHKLRRGLAVDDSEWTMWLELVDPSGERGAA